MNHQAEFLRELAANQEAQSDLCPMTAQTLRDLAAAIEAQQAKPDVSPEHVQ
ncbi:MAG: hypothetical protein HY508_10875 [Acidobacteria bacterium]|nr:hypothetical protein [Acidobacteriota bacterium]